MGCGRMGIEYYLNSSERVGACGWWYGPIEKRKRRLCITNNSSFQNYPHPDEHTIRTTDTPKFKPFTMLCILFEMRLHRSYYTQLNNNRCIVTHVCVDTPWIWITAANAFLTLVDLLTDLFGVLSVFQTNPRRSIPSEAIRTCGTLITRNTVLTLVAFIAGIGAGALWNIVKHNNDKVEWLVI